MDVGQLMRSILGNTRPSSVKALELKVGQVVKGVVMQLLSESEALLQIEGMPVRARLQTPLSPGQSTLLQVQPESEDGYIVFKPLEQSQIPLLKQSLEQILKAWSLPIDGKHKQMLQLMQQNQIPLEKQIVKQLMSLTSALPKSITAQQAVQSAALVMQRGLPLNAESLQAVNRIHSGPPLTQLWQKMTDELEQYVHSRSQLSGSGANQVAGHAGPSEGDPPARLLLLMKGMLLAQSGADTALGNVQARPQLPTGPPLSAGTLVGTSQSAAVTTAAGAGADAGKVSSGSTAAASGTGTQSSQAGTAAAAPAGNEQFRTSAVPQPSNQWVTGSTSGGAAPRFAINAASQLQEQTELKQSASPTASSQPLVSKEGQADPTTSAKRGESVQTGASPLQDSEHELQRWYKQLGVHHERDSWKLLLRALTDGGHSETNDTAELRAMRHGDSPTGEISSRSTQETVKSLLLQMTQMDELPASLKESSTQLLQHITGQQLMMGQERGTMLSHMTLILPSGPDQGGKDISVTVQARRGSKGEIDASNCRLLFDLHLASLGNTMIDVQVVNQVVQLRVLNDEPDLDDWMQKNMTELKHNMHVLGFVLSGLHQSPYPVSEGQAAAGQEDMNDSFIRGQINKKLSPPAYKGVDIRL